MIAHSVNLTFVPWSRCHGSISLRPRMLHPLDCNFRRKLKLLALNSAVSAIGTITGRVAKGNSRTTRTPVSPLRMRNCGAPGAQSGASSPRRCEMAAVYGIMRT
jgi:hypothetical protein